MIERCRTGIPAWSSVRGNTRGSRPVRGQAGREAHCSPVTTAVVIGSGGDGVRLREQCGPEQGAGRSRVRPDRGVTLPESYAGCPSWPGRMVRADDPATMT